MSYIFRKAEKQVCFEDFDKNHADLKIRLHYDGMRKYIDKDVNMMKIIEEYKEEKGSQSAQNRKKSKQLIEKGRDLQSALALNPDDVETIFDILEKEQTEL